MFVSRAGIRSDDGRCGQTVLIELDEQSQIDKAVIPAVLECVLNDIVNRNTTSELHTPNVVLLSVDRHPKDFEGLCRRSSIPASNIIDGYSEWYSLHRNGESDSNARDPKQQRSVHIGAQNPTSEEQGCVAREILAALDSSKQRNSKQRIVVIDSLTSIFRLWPGIQTFLDLRDKLNETTRGAGRPVTLLGMIRHNNKDIGFAKSLRRVADTFIVLKQGLNANGEKRFAAIDFNDNSRDVITLKTCKRKFSGRVQLDEVTGTIKWENQTLINVEVTNDGSSTTSVLPSKEEEERRQQESLAELGLSFRVSLSTKEKEVRAAAGLPYLHRDESLADSGLQLHPKALQIGSWSTGNPDVEDVDDPGDDTDSEEDLFSEDV